LLTCAVYNPSAYRTWALGFAGMMGSEVRYCAGMVMVHPSENPTSVWADAERDLEKVLDEERARWKSVELVDEPFRRGPLQMHDEEGNHIADGFQVVQRIRIVR
jgi:hypothetical protein